MIDQTRMFKDWATGRLEEMSASLAAVALTTRMSQLSEDARRAAEGAVAEMRREHDRLQSQLQKTQEWNAAAYEDMQKNMKSGWSNFMEAMQKAVAGTQEPKQIFQELAEAQLKAWQNSVALYQRMAKDLQSRGRADFDKMVQAMQVQANATREKFQSLNKGGTSSWSAFSPAFNESHKALEKANEQAYETWKKLLGG